MKRNIAVVGCGSWGNNLVRNLSALDALYAICDCEKKVLKDLASLYPDAKLYQEYDSVLKDPGVKAVVISTPTATHFSLASKALLADKDVFVEKPIALKYEDGKKLVALSSDRNKILMTGHILEFHPAITKLGKMVEQGELGKIQYIYSNRLNLGKFRTEENILWSFAPHDISVILRLLQEMPDEVSAHGGNYLSQNITDVTITTMNFPQGVKAHIFVSWLHPYKEQKLVIIGNKKMAVFDDVSPGNKLFLYHHKIEWIERQPIPMPEDSQPVEIEYTEPLKAECQHFINCIESREKPLTDGENGLKVLKILEACQESLKSRGKSVSLGQKSKREYFVHPSSFIDKQVQIGKGTKIWHVSHILSHSIIGKDCTIGQNVVIGPNVCIGNNVKIQNNVSVYEGVSIEDDVFCGPSLVFTNVLCPRSHWPRKDDFKKTLIKKGASLGANATVVCGHTIGRYALVGAGALVDKDIPDFALFFGVPARLQGWVCYCGIRLSFSTSPDSHETTECRNCGRKYIKEGLAVSFDENGHFE